MREISRLSSTKLLSRSKRFQRSDIEEVQLNSKYLVSVNQRTVTALTKGKTLSNFEACKSFGRIAGICNYKRWFLGL